MASRRYNAARNIAWAVVNKVMVIIMPFAVRTAMIYCLGVEYTGLCSLFTSVLTVLSLAELGFSSAMVFSMYEPINKGDTAKLCALLKFYRLVYRVIGVAVLVVGLVLVPFLPMLIKGSAPGGIDIYVLYAIYLSNTVASYFLYAHKVSLLTAWQRGDVVSKVGLATSVGMYVLQIAVLVLTQNFYVYAALLPISTVANNVACNVLSRRLFPDIACGGNSTGRLSATSRGASPAYSCTSSARPLGRRSTASSSRLSSAWRCSRSTRTTSWSSARCPACLPS